MHYTFAPLKPTFDSLLWLSIGFILFSSLLAYCAQFIKNIDAARKNIIYLLCFFIGFIALVSLGIRVITIFRLQPIEIDAMKIKTPYGATSLTEIKDFYIKTDRQFKPNNPDVPIDSTRFLVIFDRKLKRQMFSEADYPIDSIFRVLDRIVE